MIRFLAAPVALLLYALLFVSSAFAVSPPQTLTYFIHEFEPLESVCLPPYATATRARIGGFAPEEADMIEVRSNDVKIGAVNGSFQDFTGANLCYVSVDPAEYHTIQYGYEVVSPTATATATLEPSATLAATETATATATATLEPSATLAATETATATATATLQPSETATGVPSITPTFHAYIPYIYIGLDCYSDAYSYNYSDCDTWGGSQSYLSTVIS